MIEYLPYIMVFVAGLLTGGSICAWLARKALYAIATGKVKIVEQTTKQ